MRERDKIIINISSPLLPQQNLNQHSKILLPLKKSKSFEIRAYFSQTHRRISDAIHSTTYSRFSPHPLSPHTCTVQRGSGCASLDLGGRDLNFMTESSAWITLNRRVDCPILRLLWPYAFELNTDWPSPDIQWHTSDCWAYIRILSGWTRISQV